MFSVINRHFANTAPDSQLPLSHFLLQPLNPIGHNTICSITSYFLSTFAMPPKAFAGSPDDLPSCLPLQTQFPHNLTFWDHKWGVGKRHTKIYSSQIAALPLPPFPGPLSIWSMQTNPEWERAFGRGLCLGQLPFIQKMPLPVGKYKHCVKPF